MGADVPPPSGDRFLGDPGVGKVITGGPLSTGTLGEPDGVADLNAITGVNHVMCRRFSSDVWSRTGITSDWNNGRIPFPSFKLNGTSSNIADIAGGSRDAAMIAEAQWCANTFPGYLHTTFFHEPEDNFPDATSQGHFRAATRRIVGIFRDQGATNVIWDNPVSQGVWAFDPTGGEASRGPWYRYDPDWKGTISGAGRPNASDWYTGADSVVDLHAFDMYNPLVGGTTWRRFDTDFNFIRNRMIADARPLKPWTVPEFGTGLVGSFGSGVPGGGQPDLADWTLWYQQAFGCMRDFEGIGFMTYHEGPNRNLTTGGSDPLVRREAYIAALTSEAAYLVTTRPT